MNNRQKPNSHSSYMLENLSHPTLDGVDEQHSDDAARSKNDGSLNGCHDIQQKREWSFTALKSNSEFVDATQQHGDKHRVEDVKVSSDDVKINLEDIIEDDNNESDDDDQVEFDEERVQIPTLDTYVPREPNYDVANSLPFAELCRRLEVIWNLRSGKKKGVSKEERIKYLLPKAMKEKLDAVGGSPYPYLRLILPEHDSVRPHTGFKESRAADTWAKALGCNKGHNIHSLLTGYRNAKLIGSDPITKANSQNSISDLSSVLMDVMQHRAPGTGSKLTVREINEWLDVLVSVVNDTFDVPTEKPTEKSKWIKSLEKVVRSGQGKKKKGDIYADLVEQLLHKNLSPVEHKYLVRIIMQSLNIGINLKEILRHINPYALDIHNSTNNLKELCKLISDPEYVRMLKATVEKNTQQIMENNRNIWMTPSHLPAVLQNTLSPMRSRRAGFDTFLKEVAYPHGQLDKALPEDSPAKSCLAIKHPAFLCEVKMDGERQLVHIKRGIVTIQAKRGVWYSHLYSPAIGPSLRAAIAAHDVDVILDGEMVAWDASEDKLIPFGSNQTVAEMTRNQRTLDGTLDPRDLNLHKNDKDIIIMPLAKDKQMNGGTRNGSTPVVSSNQYWLLYVVFDILYVDGPGAKDLISKSSHLFAKDEKIQTGSVINMSCMQRKSILYNLIQPQKNVVELNRSAIIRSDGSSMDARDYFLGSELEYGKMPSELDSIHLALSKSDTTKFDSQRMSGRSHEDIEIQRSLELQALYNDIVTTCGQEGLMFKDLASPYYLGAASRNKGSWWKIKPDYDQSGAASDIDLLVLGGFWADGFDKRGLLSSFLVGCLDSDHPYGGENAKYMVLSKVNHTKLAEKILLEETKFKRATEDSEMSLGKWFESADDIPGYISTISYQRGPKGDRDGWKNRKKDTPDVWIRPEDSFVVTINAAEYQASVSMQTGFVLRFPRITKYRGGTSDDPKSHDDIENWAQMHQIFIEQEESRKEELKMGSQSKAQQPQTSRFLTAKQLQMSGKEKKPKSRKLDEVKQFSIPEAGKRLSSVLEGFLFSVQPGNYSLDDDEFAIAQAERDGWLCDAEKVTCQKDVQRYIQSHGGTCQLNVHRKTDFLLGGRATDASISNLKTLMENTDRNSTSKREADARRLLEMGGILKWTFVYAIVSKCLKRLDNSSSGYEQTIKKDWPHLIDIRSSDFLVMSDAANMNLRSSEDDYGLHINKLAKPLEFGRALEEVGRQMAVKKKGDSIFPWQTSAINMFDENERWVFGLKAQKLWPKGKYNHATSEGGNKLSLCILYPDLFEDLGFEEKEDADKETKIPSISPRWEETMASKVLGKVNAVLPLAKALGAIVTPHLHSGVTHILCDLTRHKILKWSSMHPLAVYSDTKSGLQLTDRLNSLEESAVIGQIGKRSVFLVSPEWLKEQTW